MQGEPSQTAVGAAFLRAAHQVLDGDPKILVDPIAVSLLPDARRDELRTNTAILQTSTFRAARAIVALRSRYAEDALGEAAASGLSQYVLLGAGLDTFAYRQPQWAHTLTIFEIDHPATQEWKRGSLERLGMTMPANLRFCPVDFETTSLQSGLISAGFDFRQGALFSWLGVTQYLTDAAIDSTLRFVLSLSRGSSIVLTFVLPEASLDGEEKEPLAAVSTIASLRGEPFVSQFQPAILCDRLNRMGFSKVIHLAPEVANDRYFQRRRDGLRAPHYEQLVWAMA
jgi:methyltransferase (TIGR00027 family)